MKEIQFVVEWLFVVYSYACVGMSIRCRIGADDAAGVADR